MTNPNINEVLTRIEQMPRGVFLFAPKIPVSQMVCKTDDLFTLAAAYKRLQADNTALREGLGEMPKAVPTSWLDPLLSGKTSVFKQTETWDGRDIEALLRGVQDRLRDIARNTLAEVDKDGQAPTTCGRE